MSGWRRVAAVVVGGWLGTGGLFGQGAPGAVQQKATAPSAPVSEKAAGKPATDATDTGTRQATSKVLFSRSDDEAVDADGKPVATKPDAGKPLNAETPAAAFEATDEERDALTFVAYDLDVRLVPRQESLAIRARITVRNDGDKPLKRIALQLSSALKWEQIQAAGRNAAFSQHPMDSDADHTGAVNEAVVTLAHALAPKAELTVVALYSGQVPVTAERLERIGAPTQVAEQSDWDQVSSDFIGLRGFGNVVWYPVSAPAVMLGDGAKLFAEMGRQKARQQQARVTMTVTSEYTADAMAPNLAVLDGQVVPVVQSAAPENSYPGVVTASLPPTTLGFATPNLFLLARHKVEGDGAQLFVTAEDLGGTQGYLTAVNVVTPLVQQWLGTKPKSQLTVVDLPDPGDVASEEGAVYFTGFKATPDSKDLDNAMVHSLAHAYFQSPRIWLSEGVAQFLGTLWIEQVQGRTVALEAMESARSALALAEPGTPGDVGGQDLMHASDTVFYRAKATYVLWMLRDVAGDAPLGAALRAYVPGDDTTPEYFERLLEKASGKDLKWFFDGWVYHDRGLADLSIAGVFPSKSSQGGQWLVALDITNDGFVEVEAPVSVRSQDAVVTERLRIPARGKVSRRMLIGGIPVEVQVNDGTVPEVGEGIHVRKLTPETPRGDGSSPKP